MLGGEPFTIYPVRGEYAELVPAKRSLVNGARLSASACRRPRPWRPRHEIDRRATSGSGPTVRYQERKDDYESDRLPVEAFVEPVRRLLPSVTVADLRLSGSGIRAEAAPAERIVRGFPDSARSREPAIVHAAGIESPGLTSCLAIGEMVGRSCERNR